MVPPNPAQDGADIDGAGSEVSAAEPRERLGRGALLGAFLAVGWLVALDQWSKGAIFAWVHPGLEALKTDVHGHRMVPVLGEWLSVMTSCNPGAAFGGFAGSPVALVSLRVVAVVVLAWILYRSDPRDRVVLVATVLVLAGAVGNVIDNLWTGCTPVGSDPGLPHGVRDFIAVWFEPLVGWDYHFPNFNVADACISVGATVWLLSGLFHSGGGRGEEAADEARLERSSAAPPSAVEPPGDDVAR